MTIGEALRELMSVGQVELGHISGFIPSLGAELDMAVAPLPEGVRMIQKAVGVMANSSATSPYASPVAGTDVPWETGGLASRKRNSITLLPSSSRKLNQSQPNHGSVISRPHWRSNQR